MNQYPGNYGGGQMENPQYIEYSKLGGALLAYVILQIIGAVLGGFAILLSLALFPILIASGQVPLALILLLSLALSGVAVALQVIMITMIYKKNYKFLTFFMVLFVLGIIAMIFSGIVSVANQSSSGSSTLGSNIWSIIWNVAIIVYFIKSVRVRTYMGSDDYITKNPFTKSITPPTPVPQYLYSPVSQSSGYPTYAATPTTQATPIAAQSANPPAGWYPYPNSPGQICWWDGERWHEDTKRPA